MELRVRTDMNVLQADWCRSAYPLKANSSGVTNNPLTNHDRPQKREQRQSGIAQHVIVNLEHNSFYVKLGEVTGEALSPFERVCFAEMKSFLITNNGSVLRQMDRGERGGRARKKKMNPVLLRLN